MFPDLREAYLSTVTRALDGTIYEDPPLKVDDKEATYDPNIREHGWDWPSRAFTMIGTKRLQNVRLTLESTIGEGIPGDFVETGVWRGGACIMAQAVLFAYGALDRRVVLCDSFEGLPPPDTEKYPADAGSVFHEYDELAVSVEEVRENFEKFGLTHDNLVFVKGFFKDTMDDVPSDQIAVLRLDGDMYESTIEPLRKLYPKVPTGGWVIIDDYHVVPASKAALHDYFDEMGIKDVTLREIDQVGVFFRKNEAEFLANRSA